MDFVLSTMPRLHARSRLLELSVWFCAFLLRGRRKIDLITLNVKLTLRGGGGSLMGLGLTLRKIWGKVNEKVRKSNN